jgi:type IX secretion system PorP/SprF family membrane protein
MKTLNKIIWVVALMLSGLYLNAQQVPLYTHYMDNTLVINPAYAGSRDALTITALARAQWVNFGGAPMTQSLTIHSPISSEHIGLGLSIQNDKIGPTNTTSAFGDFAYIMNLGQRSKLALGLSGGVNIFQADLNSLELDQQSDPAFMNNISNRTTFNFGFGAYYHRERFYAGVSVPNLLQNNYSKLSLVNESALLGKEQRHYYFISGAMIRMTDNLAFKPTMLLKLTPAAPLQADLTASFLIVKRLLVGAMVRTGDAFGGLVGLNITDQFHLGYSFDWSYGIKTSKYNQGSHEIMLRYDFIFSGKKQIHSPRYF